MVIDEFSQGAQCTNRNGGRGFVPQRGAINRIQHPRQDGELQAIFSLDNHARCKLPAKAAHHFDFLIEEGMMAVANPRSVELMSSVLTP